MTALPATMQAWQVERIDDTGAMRLAELPLPTPAAGHLLVEVEAAGLNFLDTLMVRGRYQRKPALPFTPGVEVIGTIVGDGGTVGESRALPNGTRIAGGMRTGGFARYAWVAHEEALALPAGMPADVALALRGSYPTALHALRDVARLSAGETLLVHAGAGGVGSAAIDLGRMLGARVIATAAGADKRAACDALGADAVIDYARDDWVDAVRAIAPDGIDVIFDPVGGEVGAQSLRCLAFRARYLVIGFAAGTLTALPANRLLLHNASAIGVLWGEVVKRDPAHAAALMGELFEAHAAGRLRPLRSTGFAFERAPEALEALATRRTLGKPWLAVKPASD
jgi:NADPH:quinone reductase